MNDDALFDNTGRLVYQPVLRVTPGVSVSLFTADLRQITGWQPLDRDLIARWSAGAVSEQSEPAVFVLLHNEGRFRAIHLEARTILSPDLETALDLSRVDRAHDPLMPH